MIHPLDWAGIYQTIDRHLPHNLHKKTQPAMAQTFSVIAAEPGATDALNRMRSEPPESVPIPELAGTLNDLLGRYVELLESSDHGGWSLEEDEVVQTVLSDLARAGYPIRQLRPR